MSPSDFPSGSRILISRDCPDILEMEDFVDYSLPRTPAGQVYRLPTLNTSLCAYDWQLACTVLARNHNRNHTIYVAFCEGGANRIATALVLRLGGKWRFAVYAPTVSGLPSTPEHQRWLNSIYEYLACLRRCVFFVTTNLEVTADQVETQTEETIAHGQVCTPPCESIADAKMMIVNWIAHTCLTNCLAFNQTMKVPTSWYFAQQQPEKYASPSR